MQIEKSFSYQFEDPAWISKLGLGALISLVPILNFAVVGYMVQIIRNVAAGVAQPLPHWDDLGRKWTEGLIVSLAMLVYAAPVLIALCLPLSMLIASGALAQNTDLQDVAQGLAGVGGVLLAAGFLLFMLYALALSIIRPVILVLFSRDGTFASCFRLREIFETVSAHSASFFRMWLTVLLAGLAISMVVGFANLVFGWVPCLGLVTGMALAFGSTMYLVTVEAHLFGQFRAEALGGVPQPALEQARPTQA